MAFSMKSAVEYKETYMLIEPSYLEEIKQDKELTDEQLSARDIDIENYINDLRNVGSNYSQNISQEELQAMSQEELQELYEKEMLMEKYGEDYEKIMNSTYEDYLNSNENQNNNKPSESDNNSNSSNDNYTGPALVFVELENPSRGKSYIEVPVFTCRDGGTVIINISIASDGRVKSANIEAVESSGDGSCISQSAKKAALNSRFTTIAGSKTEYGKITYQFIQQ